MMETKTETLQYYSMYDPEESMYVYRDGEYAVYVANADSRSWSIDPDTAFNSIDILMKCSEERSIIMLANIHKHQGKRSMRSAHAAMTGEYSELEDLKKLIVVKVCSDISIEQVSTDQCIWYNTLSEATATENES